jgi:hypothetical protein
LRQPDLPEEMRTAAQTQRDAITPRLGQIVVRTEGDASGVTIRLDERELPAEGLGIGIPVDPGAHEATATRGGEVVVRESAEVAESARAEILLRIPAAAVVVTPVEEPDPIGETPPPPPPADDPTGIIIGVVVGVVVVGAAAAITAVVLTQPGAQSPIVGNVGPGVITW